MFAFTIRHKLGILPADARDARRHHNDVENTRLRSQVQQLQDRIMLERIVTDRGVETAAQIEALRDRDHIKEEDQA
jgi:hypothetical protein